MLAYILASQGCRKGVLQGLKNAKYQIIGTKKLFNRIFLSFVATTICFDKLHKTTRTAIHVNSELANLGGNVAS